MGVASTFTLTSPLCNARALSTLTSSTSAGFPIWLNSTYFSAELSSGDVALLLSSPRATGAVPKTRAKIETIENIFILLLRR